MNHETRPAARRVENAGDDQPIDDVALFRRKRVIIPLLLLLIATIIGAGYWYLKRHASVSTDDAFVDADRMTVSPKMLGRIERLLVDEGDTIRAGDTLVRLDDADLRAQLAKVNASIRSLTQNGEIAAVNLAKAQDDFSRTEKQFAGKIVTQEQFNHAGSALKLAQAQAAAAAAQIATAQADLAIVKTQLGNTVLCAPFNGVVAKRWALTGEIVQPGQAIFSLYDKKNIYVTANFEETKLHSIHVGQAVTIAVDALPGHAYVGKVTSIGRSTASLYSLIPANNASGNFTKITQRVPVKIAFGRSSGADLLPGLSAYVAIAVR
jgi:membrane fusion protein, multidrug efflux system